MFATAVKIVSTIKPRKTKEGGAHVARVKPKQQSVVDIINGALS